MCAETIQKEQGRLEAMSFSIEMCAETMRKSKAGGDLSFSIEMCAETMRKSKAGWRQCHLV